MWTKYWVRKQKKKHSPKPIELRGKEVMEIKYRMEKHLNAITQQMVDFMIVVPSESDWDFIYKFVCKVKEKKNACASET